MSKNKPSYQELENRIKELEVCEQELIELKNKENNSVQTIMENIPGYAFIKDINLNYISANQTFCDLLNIPYNEIKGKTDYDIFPQDLAEKYIADDKKVMESREPIFVEETTVNLNKNGHRFVVATRKHPLLDKNGNVCGIYGLGFDISELKFTEAELKKAKERAEENEEKYKTLFEHSPISVWEEDFSQVKVFFDQLNLNGIHDFRNHFNNHPEDIFHIASLVKIVNINETSVRFFEAKNKEEIKNNLTNYFNEGSLNVFKEEIISLAEGKTNFECEIPILTLKKEIKVLALHLKVCPGFEHNLSKVIISFIDITEQKRVENEYLKAKEKAEENEKLFRNILNNTSFHLWAFDGFKYYYVNKNWFDFSGQSTNEPLTINRWIETVHPEDLAASSEILKNHLITKTEHFNYFRLRRYDGVYRNFLCHAVPIFDEKNNFKYFQGYNIDITEQKIAEEELKQKNSELLKLNREYLEAKEKVEESEKNYKNLVEHLPHIIYKYSDQKGGIYWSEKIKDILGFSADEIKTNPFLWNNAIHPDDKPTVKKAIEDNEKGEDYNIEYRIKTKWGKWIWLHDYFMHKTLKGNEIIIEGIATDITNRKNAEILIKQKNDEINIQNEELKKAKEKAEESDKLKTAFLQNMSHEIRTPLNAISGFSGMLNKQELSEEKRKSFISIIQNSSKQLVSIVSDILTISSLETNQEKTNIEKVCLNDILLDLHAIFKQQSINQNISLYTKQELNNTQSEIYTDKTKIIQILSNLLSNALKFTYEGFIEFGYILKINTQPAEIEFYVKDSGIGIKQEYHEKIFERFRQADKSINKLYGGTGLGLAISKAFTELLGGKIWVRSEPEKGSTFYFTIPYTPVHSTTNNQTLSQDINNHPVILIAEDEEYNYMFIEELLIDLNLKLIHAKNGKEAVDAIKSNSKIDLILMDIKMPIMTGYEAAKIIKGIKPDLPILAQSAYALEHERAIYEDIFDGYITKPIDATELKQVVMKHINIIND